MAKLSSVGFISPSTNSARRNGIDIVGREEVYSRERKVVRDEFTKLGTIGSWKDPEVKERLQVFAKQVINTTQTLVSERSDLISMVLPTETILPGDTFVLRNLHGVNVYYGTYGASVRMSRPQFTQYTQTTNLKEVGLKLELNQIRVGKYSPSELADYTAGVIEAWRNRLLFVTTLGGMTAYQSGGDQHLAGTNVAFATVEAALDKLTDEADAALIVGRRKAIALLANMTGWSDTVIDEYKGTGVIGMYAGIPVKKVYSFTDPDYGWVSPMDDDDLWIFSSLPAGAQVVADKLRTDDEIIAANETMNMYFRWDDGIGIFHTNRIVRLQNLT